MLNTMNKRPIRVTHEGRVIMLEDILSLKPERLVVDCGFGFTKVLSEGAEEVRSLRSMFAEVKPGQRLIEGNLNSPVIDIYSSEEATKASSTYHFGERAKAYDSCQTIVDITQNKTDWCHLQLLASLPVIQHKRKRRVELTVLSPTATSAETQKELAKKLQKTFYYSFNGLRGEVEVTKVDVVSEGLASYLCWSGANQEEAEAHEHAMVVDLGTGTVVAQLLQFGQERASISLPRHGAVNLASMIASDGAIVSKNGGVLDATDIITAIAKGKTVVEDINFSAQLKALSRVWLHKVMSTVVAQVKNRQLSSPTLIIFTGGCCLFAKEAIEELAKSSKGKKTVVVVDNPQFSNVYGAAKGDRANGN